MQSSVAAILAIVLLPVAAAIAKDARPDTAGAVAAPAASPVPVIARRTPFTHFGAPPVLELRGNAGAASVDFGSRADELVTAASLRIRYAYSPGLIEARSHIRLTLNNEVIGLLPVKPEESGRTVTHDIDVDPRLIVGFNRLAMDFVAQRAAGPEDPARPGLWADISGASELAISARALVVSDDLALLPEPFFDRHDQRRVTLPFIFGARPSLPTLRAATVVASWFGQLAAWRGVRFPASLDGKAQGHAIAFATNAERAAFLGELPPITGPELRVTTNPADGRSKLLLVLGRDGDDLKAAADALVLGSAALSGAAVKVKDVAPRAPRPAYDAPGWVRVDRAMRFGELIAWPQQLQAEGTPPRLDAIRVDLRMPPDLATWRGPGVPMMLKFRYTPPACATQSHLDVSINDELLKVVSLNGADRAGDAAAARQPLPEAMVDSSEILIPAFRLRGRIQLQFVFRFVMRAQGDCRDATPAVVRAAVDADSSIDFSGFPHYAQMPNLGHFVSVGFPFTKHADLSQTVVVVPDTPTAPEIEALLTVSGRMGESTGHPATGVRLAGAGEEALFAGADLLVIGTTPRQALLDKWRESIPVSLSGTVRRVSQPARSTGALLDWLGFGRAADAAVAGHVRFEGPGPLAALLEFESPVTPGRSVVALTAVAPDQLTRILDALDDPKSRDAMRGSAVFVHPHKVESLLVGPTYETGFLPPWTGILYRLSGQPLLLAVVAAIALSILGYAAWRLKRAVMAIRGGRRT